MKDITKLFKNTKSKLIQSLISKGNAIIGEKVIGKKHVLTRNKELANNIANKLEQQFSIKGFISTDELPAYGISKEEKTAIEQEFECDEKDVVVFVITKPELADSSIALIIQNLQ